jgi:hypothetical protein
MTKAALPSQVFLRNNAGTVAICTLKITKVLNPFHISCPYTQNQFMFIVDLKVKIKLIKLLEYNIEGHYNLQEGNIFKHET